MNSYQPLKWGAGVSEKRDLVQTLSWNDSQGGAKEEWGEASEGILYSTGPLWFKLEGHHSQWNLNTPSEAKNKTETVAVPERRKEVCFSFSNN